MIKWQKNGIGRGANRRAYRTRLNNGQYDLLITYGDGGSRNVGKFDSRGAATTEAERLETENAEKDAERERQNSSGPLRPFSGRNYYENSRRLLPDETSCALCGKPVKDNDRINNLPNGWRFLVRVVDGGDRFATEDEFFDRVPVDPAGDMLFFPVGSTCAKNLRKSGVFVGSSEMLTGEDKAKAHGMAEAKSKAEIEADFDRFEAEIEAREVAIKAFAEQHRDKVIGMPVLERFTRGPEFVVVHEDKDGWRISRFEGTLARPRAATGHTYRKDFETALHDAVRDYHGDLSRAEITENHGHSMTESTMKSKKKMQKSLGRRGNTLDLRQLGADHAQEQLDSDYFRDWVRDQLLEGEQMRRRDPSSVIPFDANVIAKNMLQQLVWDTKRNLRIPEVVGRGVSGEEADEFMEGFEEHAKSKDKWLADEILEQTEEAGVGDMREASRGLPRSDDYRNYTFFVSLWDFRDPSKGYSATLMSRRGQSVNSINGDSEEEVREAAKKHWPGAREVRVKAREMRETEEDIVTIYLTPDGMTKVEHDPEALERLLHREVAFGDGFVNIYTRDPNIVDRAVLFIGTTNIVEIPNRPKTFVSGSHRTGKMRESWQPGGTSIAMESSGRHAYAVEAGRTITRDGLPFVSIIRESSAWSPVVADEATHTLATALTRLGEKRRPAIAGPFTVEPGRHIHRNGQPFISVQRDGKTIPVVADDVTHVFAYALNQMNWTSPYDHQHPGHSRRTSEVHESWQPGGTSIAMEDRSHLPRSQVSLEDYEREVLKRLRYIGVPNLTTRSTPIGEEARMLVLNGWRQGRKPFSTATEIERAWRESSKR